MTIWQEFSENSLGLPFLIKAWSFEGLGILFPERSKWGLIGNYEVLEDLETKYYYWLGKFN